MLRCLPQSLEASPTTLAAATLGSVASYNRTPRKFSTAQHEKFFPICADSFPKLKTPERRSSHVEKMIWKLIGTNDDKFFPICADSFPEIRQIQQNEEKRLAQHKSTDLR